VCVLKLRAEMPDVLCRAGPYGHSFILYRYRSRIQIMTATSATMSCCCSSRATTRH
jgi:hypothetical protein